MEALKRALFEDPFYIYVVLAFAELALAAVWHARRTRGRLAAMLIPLVLAGGVFLTERLVVTDREQIRQAMRRIAEAVESGSFDEAVEYIDDRYTGFHGDKAHLAEAGRGAVKAHGVRSLRYVNPKLEVDGDEARLRVTTVIELAGQVGSGQAALVWNIRWIRRPQGWRIWHVDTPEQGVDLK